MYFKVKYVGLAGLGKIVYEDTVYARPYNPIASNGMEKDEYYADQAARIRKQCLKIEQVAKGVADVDGVSMRLIMEETGRFHDMYKSIPGFSTVLDKLFADFNTWTFYVDLGVHEGYNTMSYLGELLIWLVGNNEAIGKAAERIVDRLNADDIDELVRDGEDASNVLWEWQRALWHRDLDDLAAL